MNFGLVFIEKTNDFLLRKTEWLKIHKQGLNVPNHHEVSEVDSVLSFIDFVFKEIQQIGLELKDFLLFALRLKCYAKMLPLVPADSSHNPVRRLLNL